MEELFDKDDAIGRLVREEGILKTSSDFTARVMHLVNESPQKTKVVYKPLLSRGAWIFIALGFLALAVISRLLLVADKTTDLTWMDRFKPAFAFVNEIHISFDMAPGTLMLATIIMASAGLLLVLDYFLNRLKMENGRLKMPINE